MSKLISFFKEETVLCIASLLAIISCFFVTVNLNGIISYINFKTLAILLAMMVVVQTLKALGTFDILVGKLVSACSSIRALVFVLVFSCFFLSMIITNDISLLTFVPLCIAALKKVSKQNLIIPVVSLQTIAANMGSMIMPFGSPHNIFIFTASGVSIPEFVKMLLPYWIISLITLILACLVVPSSKIDSSVRAAVEVDKRDIFKRVVNGVDYFLLLTFVAFYILIGNLQNIPAIASFFEKIVSGRELICTILACQIISNVPGGMMISGFSNNYTDIIIGVNIGGLGTLIASMANLISYKIFAKEFNNSKGKFLGVFTGMNLLLLGILLGFYYLGI